MKLPAQIYEIFCPHCACRIEYPLFMASFYDFATFRNLKSQEIVRVDLEGVHRQKLDIKALLKDHSKRESGDSIESDWINLQDTNYCDRCTKCFSNKAGKNLRFCVEENIEAVTLP